MCEDRLRVYFVYNGEVMEIRIVTEVAEFIESLDPTEKAKVLHSIDLLEMFGYRLGMPHSKKISGKIFELRTHGKQAIRILYAFHELGVVLLRGFIKKTDRISKREIDTAQLRLDMI